MRKRAAIRKHRGYVLFLSVVALLAFLVIAVFSLQFATHNVRMSGREVSLMRAYNVAEANADYAEAWLRAQTTLPVLHDYPSPDYAR